jgi:DNA-binding CsgD family transcriptional regulator
LTLDPERRASRALHAAQAKRLAGALESALELAAVAERGPLDQLQLAQLDALRGQISFAGNRGNAAAPLMLRAATRLEQVDLRLARETYLDALTAAIFAGRLALDANALEVATAARSATASEEPLRASELLLKGLALLITDGYKAGTSVLKRALTAFPAEPLDERLRWSWVAGATAGLIWDYDNWDELTARQEQLARNAGALTVLPITLTIRAGLSLLAGQVKEAEFLVDQVQVVTDASDNERYPRGALLVSAFRGHEGEARQLIEATIKDSLARGEGVAVSFAFYATALLCNGLAKYDEAFRAATEALLDPNDIWYAGWARVELVEAASRTGNTDSAAAAMEKLVDATNASGTDWALGIQARCRALRSEGEEADSLYQEAIERLASTRLRFELARGRLLYGEWLRRERRQRDARAQLRIAHELFSGFGTEAFAHRAGVELHATGETVRKRTVGNQDELTAQESRVAQLAAQGISNQDIAARMFISLATVEYHLSKVYRKLGVKSRTQLANTLPHQDQRTGDPR